MNSISSLLKLNLSHFSESSSVLRSLNEQEKKIGVFALAIFSLLAVCSVCYLLQRCFRAKKLDEEDAPKIDVKEDKIDAKNVFDQAIEEAINTNNINKSDLGLGDLEFDQLPNENKTKIKEDAEENAANFLKGFYAQPLEEKEKVPNEVDATNAADDAVKHKNLNEDDKRIIYRGFNVETNDLTLTALENLVEPFKLFINVEDNQFDENIVYIDYNSFGKEHDLKVDKFEIFIRYLVLNQIVYSYSYHKDGCILYLKEDAQINDNNVGRNMKKKFSLDTLIMIDNYMQEKEAMLPPTDAFPAENEFVVNKILKAIQRSYYFRVAHNKNYAVEIDFKNLTNLADTSEKTITPLLDQLVKSGIVHSWNIRNYPHAYILLLEQGDAKGLGSSKFVDWRTKEIIEKEEAFNVEIQKECEIREKFLNDDHLNDENLWTEDLKAASLQLMEQLKQRVAPRPYEYHTKELREKMLQRLVKLGIIYGFERKKFSGTYEIYFNEIDTMYGVI